MLIQDQGAFKDVGCLIFDEVHYLADPERGTAWEESILLAPDYVPSSASRRPWPTRPRSRSGSGPPGETWR